MLPFYPEASQNPTDDIALSFLCDDVFSHQVLPIKDDMLKGAKGTISLARAKDVVPGPNCMLKSL